MVGSKFIALLTHYSSLGDQTSSSPSSDSIATPRETTSRNWCKDLSVIQQSDQNLWPFWAVTQVWPTTAPRHLITIPSLPQAKGLTDTSLKLSAWSNGWIKSYRHFELLLKLGWQDLLVTGSDSIATQRKSASGNSCKNLSAIQLWDQKLWPFWPVTHIWPTRPPRH